MDVVIQQTDGGAVFAAKIVPGSGGNTRICGVLDGMLKIKVSAPPEKGKANQCLLKFLAKTINVKRNALSIVAGKTSPVKHLRVSGMSPETLGAKLKQNARDAC